jgi:hypothetical protein
MHIPCPKTMPLTLCHAHSISKNHATDKAVSCHECSRTLPLLCNEQGQWSLANGSMEASMATGCLELVFPGVVYGFWGSVLNNENGQWLPNNVSCNFFGL